MRNGVVVCTVKKAQWITLYADVQSVVVRRARKEKRRAFAERTATTVDE